jgi:hypothetical protein
MYSSSMFLIKFQFCNVPGVSVDVFRPDCKSKSVTGRRNKLGCTANFKRSSSFHMGFWLERIETCQCRLLSYGWQASLQAFSKFSSSSHLFFCHGM